MTKVSFALQLVMIAASSVGVGVYDLSLNSVCVSTGEMGFSILGGFATYI